MSDMEEMQRALDALAAKEAEMLPERERLREATRAAIEAERDHSALFKPIRDARAELEHRIAEAGVAPRPISDRTDALIQAVVASAASDATAPVVDVQTAIRSVAATADSEGGIPFQTEEEGV